MTRIVPSLAALAPPVAGRTLRTTFFFTLLFPRLGAFLAFPALEALFILAGLEDCAFPGLETFFDFSLRGLPLSTMVKLEFLDEIFVFRFPYIFIELAFMVFWITRLPRTA